MRLTKIVCTLGPASSSKDIQTGLVKAGMDVARLNFSHGVFEDHLANIGQIREITAETGKKVAILADLPGPKIRLEGLESPVEINEGDTFSLFSGKEYGSPWVNYKGLADDLTPGDIIFINEGQVKLKVRETAGREIKTNVLLGGKLRKGNGVSIPQADIKVESVSDKDITLALQAAENGVDWLAQSFVRKSEDVAKLREALASEGHTLPIMAKIEKKEAVENLTDIISVADGVMVARGDLGVELSPEDVPVIQKKTINLAMEAGKPVVTATQMLESMINSPSPTRAEASDVANAIFDETDAIMLSGETAIGKYPVETVEVMQRITAKTEANINYGKRLEAKGGIVSENVTDAISYGSAELARDLKAKVIITATQSGNTAIQVAKYRPPMPVLAVTPEEKTALRLKIAWGVYPVVVKPSENIDDMFEIAISAAKAENMVREGDKAVITAGVIVNVPGTTNLIKVQEA